MLIQKETAMNAYTANPAIRRGIEAARAERAAAVRNAWNWLFNGAHAR